MKTRILKISRAKPDIRILKETADILKKGGIAVVPTDTVYGLAVNAFDMRACKKVFALKGRSYRKPLVIMVPDIKALKMIAQMPAPAHKLLKKFWPGPLTLVLPSTLCGSMLMGGRSDLGLRIPDDNFVLNLLKMCTFPLATTSANPSKHTSAKNGREAVKYFKNKVDIIIDAGPCTNMRESTVLDMLHFPYVVRREGVLPSKTLLKYI